MEAQIINSNNKKINSKAHQTIQHKKSHKQHLKKKKSAFKIITFAIILILLVTIGCCGAVIVKLSRRNLYSKSINLDNNYLFENNRLANAIDAQPQKDPTASGQPADISSKEFLETGGIGLKSDTINCQMEKIYKYLLTDSTANDLIEDFGFPNKMESYVFKSSFYPLDYKRASPIKRKTVNSIMATAFWQFSANGDNINTRIRINKMLGKPILNTEDKKVIDVPYISQKGILPNGCESVSATMLLQYYGFEITPQKFISDYLVKSPVKVKWGCRYGPNPKLAYAGDPRSEKNSYGCFAPVIEKSLNDYMPEDYFAQTFKNKSLETLAHDYIDNDIPVLVWATVGMDEVDKILQWQSYDKKETFLYPSNEHCMVFVGYDENNYYFNDPYNSNGVIGYPKEKAISSYNSLGCQAVIINKEIFD